MNFFLLAVYLASLFLKLFYVSDFHFAFTIDQARDMLEIRRMAVGLDPVFIGPITSLNGIFLGPFWFYLNLIPFVAGGGNPTALAYFQVILIHLGVLVYWLYFRTKNSSLAFWGSILLLFSPRLFEAGTYSFNANATPIFVLFSLLLLDSTLRSMSVKKTIALGILTGLTLQMEAAFGVLILPLCLFWLKKEKVSLLPFIAGFLFTLIPQALFEVKHNFAMTKVFLSEFSGGTSILGQKLDQATKLIDRYHHYLGSLSSAFPFPRQISYSLPLLAGYVYFLYRSKKIDAKIYRFFLINISIIIFSIILYLVYPNRLKDWWSINFIVPYILIASIAFSNLPKRILLFALLVPTAAFFVAKYNYRLSERSDDRALLLNQIEVIDWIYTEASGGGYRVFVFTPAVYDFNYQYLFWWYGNNKYGYLPELLTYQEGVPAYVENNERYWINTKPSNGGPTFLIIETDPVRKDRQELWRSRYDNLCPEKTAMLTGGILIEKLNSCSPKR